VLEEVAQPCVQYGCREWKQRRSDLLAGGLAGFQSDLPHWKVISFAENEKTLVRTDIENMQPLRLNVAQPIFLSVLFYVYEHFVTEEFCGRKNLGNFLRFLQPEPHTLCMQEFIKNWEKFFLSSRNVPVPYMVFREEGMERNCGCTNFSPNDCNEGLRVRSP
jgi:hypothetical protein